MIVGIIGNCQCREIAQSLMRQFSDLDIRYYHTGKKPELEKADSELDDLDVVVSQWLPDTFGPLETQKVKARAKTFVPAPLFSFTGFQPDITYVKSEGKDFASPLGAYHSRIVVASYLAGIKEERVEKLFNSYIYRLLGYFDEYEISKTRLESGFKKIDLNVHLSDFNGQRFMHTLNHPTALAITHIAKALAEKIGLDTGNWSFDADLQNDGLAIDTIWPIYPEIARPLGLKGDMRFKPHESLVLNNRTNLTLQELISESYQRYRERSVDTANLGSAIEILKREVRA